MNSPSSYKFLQFLIDKTDVGPFLGHDEQNSNLDRANQLQTTLDLYQGDFLTGFSLRERPEFETWALLRRE